MATRFACWLATLAVAGALALPGCSSMSGIIGSSGDFKCKAPKGVTCTSMSGVYANADAIMRKPPDNAVPDATMTPRAGFRPAAGAPLFAPPEVVRIWFAPWRDDANDLHDESMIYTVRSPGHWIIEPSGATTPATLAAPGLEEIAPRQAAR